MSKLKKVIYLVLMVAFFTVMFAKDSHATEFDIKSYLDKTLITLGAGYKFSETKLKLESNSHIAEWSEPVSARIEVYYQYNDNITFGISHHSQWLTGWPVNDKAEYAKTEIFIDYTFSVGSLF